MYNDPKDYAIAIGDGHGLADEIHAATPGKRTGVLPDGTQILENEFNKEVVALIAKMLREIGFEVLEVAPELWDVPLSTRTDRANEYYIARGKKNMIYISCHCNAYNGIFDGKAGGLEVYSCLNSIQGKILAQNLYDEIIKGTFQAGRGIKEANFWVLRKTLMPAALIEYLFMDKLSEAYLMRDESFLLECATETVKGICAFHNVQYTDSGMPLVHEPRATQSQTYEWAKKNGMCDEGLDLIPLYYDICEGKGLDPVLQYVQMCHETGFLYKNGSAAGLTAEYHNPCGLKVTQGGGDYVASAHKVFKDWAEGIDAHTDHSALYAGVEGYPRADSPDPRHFAWIFGKAPLAEQLSGRWAPSTTYHEKLVLWTEQVMAQVVDEEVSPVYDDSALVDELKAEIVSRDTIIKDLNFSLEKKVALIETINKELTEEKEKVFKAKAVLDEILISAKDTRDFIN